MKESCEGTKEKRKHMKITDLPCIFPSLSHRRRLKKTTHSLLEPLTLTFAYSCLTDTSVCLSFPFLIYYPANTYNLHSVLLHAPLCRCLPSSCFQRFFSSFIRLTQLKSGHDRHDDEIPSFRLSLIVLQAFVDLTLSHFLFFFHSLIFK